MPKTPTEEIAAIFDVLDRGLTGVYVRWKFYKQLYMTTSLRRELLNETACTFFVQLEAILGDDITLELGRITDREKTCGKANATLRTLVLSLDESGEDVLANKLKILLSDIEDKVEAFRTHRDKLIAHRDLEVSLGRAPDPPTLTRTMVDDALARISEFMNEYHVHFSNGNTIYDFTVTTADAACLVQKLKAAAVFEDILREDPMTWFAVSEKHKYHDA